MQGVLKTPTVKRGNCEVCVHEKSSGLKAEEKALEKDKA